MAFIKSFLFQKRDLHHFTQTRLLDYLNSVVAKSTASRDKLNILQANDSTPISNRAFFVREFRTPKINPLTDLFSMVGRKGQRLIVGCFPVMAVCHPFTSYRPNVTAQAVSLTKQLQDTAKMLFKFILRGKRRLKIAIHAKTEAEARKLLNLRPQDAVFYARLKGGVYA